MTAFAALVLADRTPANVTFNPAGQSPDGVARFMTNDSVFDAKRVVTMQVSLPKNGSPVARVKQRVTVPIMDAVDTTKKLGEAYINIETVFPKNCSEAVRLDLKAFGQNLLANAVSTAAFQNLEAIY